MEIPVLLDAGESSFGAAPQQESTKSISAVLPSDMLCALHKAGPEAALFHLLLLDLSRKNCLEFCGVRGLI